MNAWDGLNRRKFPRANYPCLVMISSGENTETILTHTDNIGIGGICVMLKEKIKLFAPVKIEIDLMDMEEHIKGEGKVVWSVQRKSSEKTKPLFYDVGVEFVGVKDSDRKRIETVVQRIFKKGKKSLYV